MSGKYREFDAGDYIKTQQDARGLLSAAVEEDLGDGVVIRAALKYVARTQNMSALARDAGAQPRQPLQSSIPKTATPLWQHC